MRFLHFRDKCGNYEFYCASMFWNAKVRPYLVDVLMLLPVVALAVAAFHLLERDRAAVQLQVKSEGERLLDHLLESVDGALSLQGREGALPPPRVLEHKQGKLITPPPFNPLPHPSPLNLTMEQRKWLEEIIQNKISHGLKAEAQSLTPEQVLEKFRFMGERERCWFIYEMAFAPHMASLKIESLKGASEFNQAHVSEAGLPFNRLAQLALIRENEMPELWVYWCDNAVRDPSPLTPHLLSTVASKDVQVNATLKRWAQDEELRALWQTMRMTNGHFNRYTQIGNSSFIFPIKGGNLSWADNQKWLVRSDRPGRLLVWSRDEINKFATQIAEETFTSSKYFYPLIEFGNVLPMSTNHVLGAKYSVGTKGTGIHWKTDRLDKLPEIIAENKVSNPEQELRVKVLLSSPELLEARIQDREVRFSLLIGASSLLSLMGIFVNRRAVRQEARLNRLKSNFISSVSHELRAPVAAVRLMAENLENGVVTNPAEQEEYYKLIHRECRRLSRLIGNLLDFARIEQNRREYSFDEVSLEELALDTLEMVKPLAEEAGVQLSYESGADVFVKGDRDACNRHLLTCSIMRSSILRKVRKFRWA